MKTNDSFEFVENPVAEFHKAATSGNVNKLTNLLQEESVSIDVQDNDGNTALNLAALNGKDKVVEFLMSNNANPAIKNKSRMGVIELAVIGDLVNIKELYAYTAKYRFDIADSKRIDHWEITKEEELENRPSVDISNVVSHQVSADSKGAERS